MYSKNRNSLKYFVRVSIVLVLFLSMGFAEYDADGVDLLGRYPYGYCPFIQARGDFLYSANGTVFQILDVHTLAAVGECITESIVSSIAVSGDYAYIANWSDGFKVIDISDPINPTLVAQMDFEGQCWDLSVSGDHAYLGNDTEGLQIIDITNPLLPSLASTFLPVETAAFEYTQVIDTIAYAASKSGLYILNVRDPAAPVQLGYAPSENGAWSVHVADTIAYLPKMGDGIRIVNVADPTNPIELGYFQTPDQAYWVEIVDNIAYVAERWSGIQILDISDLTAPDSVGMFPVEYADAIHILGDSLYLASSSWGLKLLDISDRLNPILLNENPGGGYARDIYTTSTHAYVTLRGLGVGVFTQGEDVEPEMIALLEMDNPNSLNGSGDYLYVIEDPNIHIIDISDPANPQIVSTWYEGSALTSYVVGHLLFVGGNPDIQILDISNPSNPELVGTLDGLPWVPFDIKIQGRFAYVVNRGGGFWIIDIADPTSPETVSGLEIFDYAWRLDVSGKYAYIADRYTGQVRIIDISDPTNPFETSGIGLGWLSQDVVCSGRYVYGLSAWDGVRIIDCADAYNPVEVGYFNTGGYAQRLHVDDGVLHVADGGGGFYKLETAYKQNVFTVNSTGDAMDANPGDGICDDGTGDCTLRAAINESNASPGYDKIAFDIAGVGPHTFQPSTAYQAITDPVIIDATTEPDYSGSPIIEIDGTNVSTYEPAFQLLGGNITIQGFVINSFIDYGINILEGGSNMVQGNYIGIDITGSEARGNEMGGIGVSTSYNIVGGISAISRNVISGNQGTGLRIYGSEAFGNVVQGNIIGLDADGTSSLGNQWDGIDIRDASDNLIGGANPGAGNVVSGHLDMGISINRDDVDPLNNIIQGNLIGTDITGTLAQGNGASGVMLNNCESTLVGGSEPGAGNVISGNLSAGLWITSSDYNLIKGNYFGTDISGSIAMGNGASGVFMEDSDHNIIGGTQPGAGNLMSGNPQSGLYIMNGNMNEVYGNLLGTDITGTEALGNVRWGIRLAGGTLNSIIGGGGDGAANVMSANGYGGIGIGYYGGAVNNYVHGNIIGSDLTGTADLGNNGSGVAIFGDAWGNSIGGPDDGSGNLIVYNERAGVVINYSEDEIQNLIQSNSIYGNGELGIDLSINNSSPYTDGITENDAGDADQGPNNLQNFPESLNVGVDDGGDLLIQYLVDSDVEHSEYPIKVEFFLSDEDGEGQLFLYSNHYTIANHELGLKTIHLGPVINYGLEMGDYLVATATDALGNTSEFSQTTQVTTYVGVAAFEALPTEFTLEQNYPNPFNPSTTIRYGLPEMSDVTMVIYDLTGRVVRSYSESSQPAGWVNYEWSGTNMRGEPVSTGVYLCRLEAGKYTKTIKMVFLK
ncbi:MAG: T9SS type A sorting domain-containing protein [Candidatus Marinimicrobia bacterium]|nr:T9SS type A sorting domain-containing protein [Candidatus Neomarinimicrobiota bacterium]